MLKLKNICKSYKIDKKRVIILDNISIDFKKKELVFILGESGSGKSTLLNIIGGNLRSDSGEILLDNQYINKFNDKELDNYRSSVIGNVFQDYNLIEYMSVWDNVMLGYSDGMSRYKINVLLKQLGIYDKKGMVVSKLSGGEKQRVAIARAMVNNPDIILADEPTGALDSKNSIEVMGILKKISKNKLVIVVSHDNNLANNYGDRIINIKDGKCEYYPVIDSEVNNEIGKKKIKNLSIIRFAIKNLWLKKMRTLLTSLAISLGIVSMFCVINLYNNFSTEIDLLERDVVSIFPVVVSNGEFDIDNRDEFINDERINIKNKDEWVHTNKIDLKYIEYIDGIDEIKYKTFEYDISMPIISDRYQFVDNKYMKIIPSLDFIYDNYEVVYGNNIENKNQILLKLDSNNSVDSALLNSFGFDSDIEYSEIIGKRVRIILNDLYYVENNGYFYVNSDNYDMYNNSNIELEVVGIIREKEVTDDNSYIYYDRELIDLVMDKNRDSRIVLEQINSNYNVLGFSLDREEMLSYLGYDSLPCSISIYVDSINDKEILLDKLDEYNNGNIELRYVDTMADAINIVKEFIMIISVVLILFSVIAIVISSLMVAILTNVRVLERKKEIGIFRSLGASRRDIRKLFNIENVIIGLLSSLISVVFVNGLVNPINVLLSEIGLDDMFVVDYGLMVVIFIINIFIIKISSSIPIRRASKLEIVNCIYNR